MREVFGFPDLRRGQAEAVAALEAGRDVIVVLPTGGGKSLCFQAPAIAAARAGRGATLVVSPLIALMEDQVSALRARGVEAACLHSGLPWAEQRAILDRLHGHALVYASPERLQSTRFRARLGRARLAFCAVDEAHCISEWGHDFRPEYRQLDVLKREFGVPVLAATATATRQVIDDIAESLGLRAPARVIGSFERPNLTFSVQLCAGDTERVQRTVDALVARGFATGRRKRIEGARAIVYAATRRRCKEVAAALKSAGVPCNHYHAGRTDGARATAQAGFGDGRYPVLVATSAFGMGVDQPDVRIVVHVQAPGTLEAYYQQAGRAGRDGEPSECLLLYSAVDAVTHKRLRERGRRGKAASAPPPGVESGWNALATYVYSTGCRQSALVAHFTEVPGQRCERCDACTDAAGVQARVDAARARKRARDTKRAARSARESGVALDRDQEAQVIAFVDALRRPISKRLVAQALRGSRARMVKRRGLVTNPHYGVLRGIPESAVIRAVEMLLAEGRLAPRGKKYPTVWIPNKPVRSVDQDRPRRGPERSPLERALRNLRRREARHRRLKPYQVFPDRTLKALLDAQPRTPSALGEIWGMGGSRIEKYGAALLEVLAAHRPQEPSPPRPTADAVDPLGQLGLFD